MRRATTCRGAERSTARKRRSESGSQNGNDHPRGGGAGPWAGRDAVQPERGESRGRRRQDDATHPRWPGRRPMGPRALQPKRGEPQRRRRTRGPPSPRARGPVGARDALLSGRGEPGRCRRTAVPTVVDGATTRWGRATPYSPTAAKTGAVAERRCAPSWPGRRAGRGARRPAVSAWHGEARRRTAVQPHWLARRLGRGARRSTARPWRTKARSRKSTAPTCAGGDELIGTRGALQPEPDGSNASEPAGCGFDAAASNSRAKP